MAAIAAFISACLNPPGPGRSTSRESSALIVDPDPAKRRPEQARRNTCRPLSPSAAFFLITEAVIVRQMFAMKGYCSSAVFGYVDPGARNQAQVRAQWGTAYDVW
jgi:hypothetical protein